ncbi:MAG: aryl-alcohol dehydrogenase [Actinomycetota bacterium]|nr:aryl-alcohol dehydrogenase [Actinomycetota bacterium]
MRPARAAVLSTPGDPFTVQQIEVGDPLDTEVLVRLTATGLCHTDLGVRFGAIPFPRPGVIGHEGAGVLETVGNAVTGLSPGQKVVLSFSSCGHCDGCVGGSPAYCRTWHALNLFAGARDDGTSPLSRDGTPVAGHFFGQSSLAEYAVADVRCVVPVPDDADLTVLAPLGCAVITGFGAIRSVLRVQPGTSLAVLGTGAVGLNAVRAAHLAGAGPIIGVDVVPERLALARDLGATHTIDARTHDLPTALAEIIGTRGLVGVLDTTGDPTVVHAALGALGTRGALALCGAPPPGTEFAVDIQSMLAGKRIVGLTMGDAVPADLVPSLVALHASGQLPLERLIRHYPLDDIEQAVSDMHTGRTVKPVIVF